MVYSKYLDSAILYQIIPCPRNALFNSSPPLDVSITCGCVPQ